MKCDVCGKESIYYYERIKDLGKVKSLFLNPKELVCWYCLMNENPKRDKK